jgi:hypothetical protein
MAKRKARSDETCTSVRVCENPLIVVCREFVSGDACATLLRMSKVAEADDENSMDALGGSNWTAAERQVVADVEARVARITGCPQRPDDDPLLAMREPRAPSPQAFLPRRQTRAGPPAPKRFPSGLHVDTNGGLPRRIASAILYLTTPGVGGQTVFPLAASAAPTEAKRAALSASHALLRAAVYHTGNTRRAVAQDLEAVAPDAPSTSTAPVGASHAGNEHGVAVRCQAGTLVVFWTRHAAGIDARSWHAGEAVAHDAAEDKWILRVFKEIPEADFDDPRKRAAFVERSRRPHMV